jgi:hypothetical protein
MSKGGAQQQSDKGRYNICSNLHCGIESFVKIVACHDLPNNETICGFRLEAPKTGQLEHGTKGIAH